MSLFFCYFFSISRSSADQFCFYKTCMFQNLIPAFFHRPDTHLEQFQRRTAHLIDRTVNHCQFQLCIRQLMNLIKSHQRNIFFRYGSLCSFIYFRHPSVVRLFDEKDCRRRIRKLHQLLANFIGHIFFEMSVHDIFWFFLNPRLFQGFFCILSVALFQVLYSHHP